MNKRIFYLLTSIVTAAVVVLSGCSISAATAEDVTGAAAETGACAEEVMPEDTTVPQELVPEEFLPLTDTVESSAVPDYRLGRYPQSGNTVYRSGSSQIDYSYASDGYVQVAHSGSTKRLKVQIVHEKKTYNYDLNTAGNFEVFPLQSGDGAYNIRIMQNVDGNRYVQLAAKKINVTLKDQLSPFLYPSQYVSYTAEAEVVKKAAELCAGLTGDAEKVAAVYDWIIRNVTYDSAKAASVRSGYLPRPDDTLTTKKGICFDYAALMAAMLRSQGVPTRLICGTVSANDLNHAWNEVYLAGAGWVTVRVYFEGSKWERMDPTFGTSNSSTIEQYIGNGTNYTTLRIY